LRGLSIHYYLSVRQLFSLLCDGAYLRVVFVSVELSACPVLLVLKVSAFAAGHLTISLCPTLSSMYAALIVNSVRCFATR
jgi:hypothetical protein